MTVAYHFKCTGIAERYDSLFYRQVFTKLLGFKEPFISTKVLSGDLVKRDIIRKIGKSERLIDHLFSINQDGWKRIIEDRIHFFIEQDVFIICFETISKIVADKLHQSLLNEEHYLGCSEIDYSDELHWLLYASYIGPKFRLLDQNIHIFVDSDDEEARVLYAHYKEMMSGIPFEKVIMEATNYRYTILDAHHIYENAKRAVEWRKTTELLFSSITDEIIAKLTDAAPEITERLWVINNTFETATTGEQYAQAMTSCRRLFEYVTDCLFPASNEIVDGHSLKQDKYKNRLFEFAKKEQRNDANIELINANTGFLFNEWNKLLDLSNKGVHSMPHRQECRRCIIRTILLLDDLISIKQSAFPVSVKADKFFTDMLEDIAGRHKDLGK